MNDQIGRNTLTGELLRGFVERVEHIDEKMQDLRDDKGVIFAEAKAAGLVGEGIRYIVKQRKKKPSERAESDALRDMYLHAMGMAADNPLFRAVGLMSVDIATRDSVITAMKEFVPVNGSIEIEAGGGPKVRLTRDVSGTVSVTEVVEKPVDSSGAGGATPRTPKARPPVPDVDGDGAYRLGGEAYRADVPIIDNPFPFGDARRPRWDEGWRHAGGGDGMGGD